MTKPRILFSRHAEEMLVERSIDRKWVELAIAEPEDSEIDATWPDVIHAFRRVPERDGRVLRVAYVLAEGTVRVVTVFFDRRRRR